MTATFALIQDTFREAFARKIFWGFFGCCTALLLFLLFIMRVDVVQGALATVTLFGRTMPSQDVKSLVKNTQGVIAGVMYFAGIGFAVFASAGLCQPCSNRAALSCFFRNQYPGPICCLVAISGTC